MDYPGSRWTGMSYSTVPMSSGGIHTDFLSFHNEDFYTKNSYRLREIKTAFKSYFSSFFVILVHKIWFRRFLCGTSSAVSIWPSDNRKYLWWRRERSALWNCHSESNNSAQWPNSGYFYQRWFRHWKRVLYHIFIWNSRLWVKF